MDTGDKYNAEIMPNPLHSVPENDKCAPENKKLKTKTAKKSRGNLPKEAVKHLKNWLNKHVLTPYPSEKQKAELAEQTNLTPLQISYWFINARRRLHWKLLEQNGIDPIKFYRDNKRNMHRYQRPTASSREKVLKYMHVPKPKVATCHNKVHRKVENKESSNTESAQLSESDYVVINKRLKLIGNNSFSLLYIMADYLKFDKIQEDVVDWSAWENGNFRSSFC